LHSEAASFYSARNDSSTLFSLDDIDRPGVRFSLFAKGEASEEDRTGV